MTGAVKIKSYRVARSGARGQHLTLPAVWVDDLALAPGDKLDVYRDPAGRLIICPPGVVPSSEDSIQARELREAMQEAGR